MGRSIQEMFNKFNPLLKDDTFFYSALIVLVAIVSFGLGRWSVTDLISESSEKAQKRVQITQPASIPTALEASNVATSSTNTIPKGEAEPQFVGSKSGTKYHLLWCPGAKQIKEENKIYFATKEEAEKAGYTPAANCKGL